MAKAMGSQFKVGPVNSQLSAKQSWETWVRITSDSDVGLQELQDASRQFRISSALRLVFPHSLSRCMSERKADRMTRELKDPT